MLPETLKTLNFPLPEDILFLKGAGEYDLAIAAIDRRLQKNIPAALRTRLEAERAFLLSLPRDYNLDEDALIAEFQSRVPSFKKEELRELLLDGRLDFIHQNGKRFYHEDTVSSLLKSTPALSARAVEPYDMHKPALNAMIARMKDHDVAFTCRLRATMTLRAGEKPARVHLPLAARSMQQSAAFDVAANAPIVYTAPEDAPQRTAYFESFPENGPLVLEYSFTQRPRYVDPMDETVKEIVYPSALPVCDDDLAEALPHLCFTPYLQALAAEIAGDETDPVRKARRFYDFITTNVRYAYQRPYRLIENAAEYTAVNLRGDCGLQALLFIALCRIAGIPARWQSGLYAQPGDVGSHDWAEFYSARLGWLPVDCSFGGTAHRGGETERWNFYFGNLDPWRMVANRRYFAPFDPDKTFARTDPYDNQRGEIETASRGLVSGEFRTSYEMIFDHEEEAET